MAKCRFPGRALKLKNRKRIKFRYDDRKDNAEEEYSKQIARGFEAFRTFFGESDEEDDLFFEGFTSEDVEKAIELNKAQEAEDEDLSEGSSTEEEEEDEKITPHSRSSRKIKQPQRFIHEDSPEDDNKRRSVGRPRKGPSLSGLGFPSSTIPSESINEGNKVYKNISLYADTISTQPAVEPLRVTRNKVPAGDSSNVSPASNKLQEKIEKLLQTQWDGRSKTSPAQKDEDNEDRGRNTTTPENLLSSKSVLRKAKLQLNKKVLQKIRNPVSAQLLLHSTEDSSVVNCAVCFLRTKCEFHYGASMCHQCCSFLSTFSGGPPLEEMACLRGFGGCQIVGISVEERCQPCWLSNALQSCTLPSLMHDKLRKKLPHYLKEKVPTSLARNVSDNSDQSRLSNSQSSSGLLGSVVDLPGGWKRNIAGPEVVVISPSGQKFKSIAKLEEYLLKLGVKADARIFFGGNTTEQPPVESEPVTIGVKVNPKNKGIPFNDSNFVVTSLPGGWIRKTKIRESKNSKTLDVLVTSPDGQTFKSKRELATYFQRIGKADDVLKYFPLFHEYEERKTPTSDTSAELHSEEEVGKHHDGVLSSEERMNQNVSDVDDGVLSDCDIDNSVGLDRSQPSLSNLFNSSFASEDASHEDFVGFDRIVTPLHTSSPSLGKSKKNNSISFTIEVPSLQHLKSAEVTASETNNTTTTTAHSSESEVGRDCDVYKKKKKKHKEKKKKKKKSKEQSRKIEKEIKESSTELVNKSLPNDSMIKTIPKENNETIDSKRIPDRIPPLPNDLISKSGPTSPATPVLKMVQTQKFDAGWTRKIKWNEEGIGRVTFVVTPSGSTIHSISELQGYLKKEGETTKSASYYFAQNLRREDVPVPKVTPKVQRKKKVPVVKNDVLKENIPNVETKIAKSEVGDTGPRIKRVCRSFEQALGMPRATFPNTEEPEEIEQQPPTESISRKDESESDEIYAATSSTTNDKNTFKKPLHNHKNPAKVLRRVLWCNRCSGCLTPNCRKCIFCMDMVKYGGPGTKKKPCINRKCVNPSRLMSDKKREASTSSKKEADKKSLVAAGNSKQLLKRSHAGKKPRTVLKDVNSNAPGDGDENCQGVFVPGQPRRNGDGIAKDSSQMKSLSTDSQMINPNFWEAFESSNVVFNGFPVVQSAPLHLTCLCFRCGAGGEEEMLYCSYCCEGVHVFCLEEGEGPLSSKEVPQWVCRRCAVCHVCGTSGYGGRKIEDLTRCSSCNHYYHLECLGPEAHKNCSSPSGALWELEVKNLVHASFPRAPAIYSVKSDAVKERTEVPAAVKPSSSVEVSSMYCYRHPDIFDASPFKLQELPHFKELMQASKSVTEPDITLITDMDSNVHPNDSSERDPICYVLGRHKTNLNRSHSNLEAEDMAAVTCVTDNILDLDFAEMDGLDLDALMDDLDDEDENCNIVDHEMQEEDIIDLYLNVDLNSGKKETDNSEVACMADDEYLSLGYKAMTEYKNEEKEELSLYRLTQMVHVELFTALQYPHISSLHKRFAVRPRHRGRNLISHAKVTAAIRDDSDTDTASDGELEESDDETEVKKKKKTPKEVLESMELRRIQYSRDLKQKLEERQLRRTEANVVENEKMERLKESIRREKLRRQPIKWVRKIVKEEKQEAPKRKRSPVRCEKLSRDDLDSSYTEDTPPPKKLKRKSMLKSANGEESKKKRKLSFEDDQLRKDKQQRLLDSTINSILKQIDEPKEKVACHQESFIQNKEDEAPNLWLPKSYEQLDAFFAARDPEYMSIINGHTNQTLPDDDALFEAAISDLEKSLYSEKQPKDENNKMMKVEENDLPNGEVQTKNDDSDKKLKENWSTLNKLKDTLIRKSKPGFKDRKESCDDLKNTVKLKRRSESKSTQFSEEKSKKLTNGNSDASETSCVSGEDGNTVRKSRRSVGRASELASLRKAKFDM